MVVLWAYFKYLKIHLALTYRSIFLRLGAFIQYRTVRHKHCPFLSFLPRMSFLICFDIWLNSNVMTTSPVFVERLTRFWRELTKKHTMFVMSIIYNMKELVRVTMHNLEKNISFSWFRNTLNVTVQFFENSETVFFFVLNHASAMLIKILRKCTHRLSWKKKSNSKNHRNMKGLQKAQWFIMH